MDSAESIKSVQQIKRADILAKIAEADMVLVGLGEEFDDSLLQKNSGYMDGVKKLKEAGLHTFLPAWNDFCMEKQAGCGVNEALEKLRLLLEQKNYFVVSVSVGNGVRRTAWKQGRLVTPCGDTLRKQCEKGCEGVSEQVAEEESRQVREDFEKIYSGQFEEGILCRLGKCPVCGNRMVFQNIYGEHYNESGYLEQWQTYLKWLQGTVNKKLFVLELGVGMKFPQVIRWPFEKAAYFNQKAFFCRVNKNLYQITEELAGKGVGISQNAIEWLSGL